MSDPPKQSKSSLFGLGTDEKVSIAATASMTVITLGFLWYFQSDSNGIGVAVCGGALGGFLHEFVQSRGKILFLKNQEDGLYLGSITGLILGIVAGILVYGGTINITASTQNTAINATLNSIQIVKPSALFLQSLLFQSLIAGLGLKGVTEAATGIGKSKDDFKIVGADLVDADAAKKQEKGILLHIKNNMSLKISLQLVRVEGVDSSTSFTQTLDEKIDGKTVLVKHIPYQWQKAKYTVTVISLNSEDSFSIK